MNNRPVSTTRIPPDIQRKLAAMAKPAPPKAPAAPAAPSPQAAPRAAAPRPAARAGGVLQKLLLAGWAVALVAIAAAAGEFYVFKAHEQSALAAQAQQYETQIASLKAQHAAELGKVQNDAAAAQQVLQTELDFQKMPDVPLKTIFRENQVLYVENESDDTFACKIRVTRPIGAVTKEFDFSLKGRAFKDMAAIEDWVFAKGDKVEFVKAGFKPRSLVAP